MGTYQHLASYVHQHSEQIKHTVDGVAGVVTVGALMEYLPHVSAILSIVWLVIRIYETDTIQKLLGHKRPEDK
jgi:hypothetical protein